MQGSRNRLDPLEPVGQRILDRKIQARKDAQHVEIHD
jgi:hypothetical protein